MIIDTDSPEGRALVALAKFGTWALDEAMEHVGYFDGDDIRQEAPNFGLLRIADCDGSCARDGVRADFVCDEDPEQKCFRYTDLAKLPEGL